ncbi:hypothetical protein ASPFODRAFT_721111 [Aspergillus luchuensis CBS 106.47]|uniref:Uncharacterized protein n=1 Tax=Aspergillus luchuensis (strain CBS 106.47) TaxID=1137211 RepID=A0A1M3TDE4_ASPLC|nr:hypothetical protein ASPFODRAFT_721111 [Aspergillus luchuensis CBS 106.47]
MSVDVAMQSSGKTVATSVYSIMQPLGGRQDPGSSCQDDPFGCVVVVSGETARRARLGAAAMKPGHKLDRENITDGEREAGAYEQAVVQETRTGMTWLAAASSLALSHDLHVAVPGAASLSLVQFSLRKELRVRVQAAERSCPVSTSSSPPLCTLELLGKDNHDPVMRGSNPLPPPNRNDMPISGRMSGLGPSVEDAPWRGSATVPPVLNMNLSRINLNLNQGGHRTAESSKVYYYSYYNLGGKLSGKVNAIAPWMGENRSIQDLIRDPSGDQPNDGDRSNNPVGQRHGEKSRRFRQSNTVHPVQ